ncbi:MAG: excinuclease ABC subunit UvrB, partial [Candidatus Ryanbacteria bacterium]|nr:excinuclease ABC subunit UvrB [Candidatus Ryanbacteria bacterium]
MRRERSSKRSWELPVLAKPSLWRTRFKEFFPENAVHYFVSYYDYYQPEAYLPSTDTYIEKDAKINAFIDELRHAATQAALARRDSIIVASVSAIYGIGSPEDYLELAVTVRKGEKLSPKTFSQKLAAMQYARSDLEQRPGTWSKKGDLFTIIFPTGDKLLRVQFFGNDIEEISERGSSYDAPFIARDSATIFPAKHFMTPERNLERAMRAIEKELKERLGEFKKEGKILEAERLSRRTRYDLKMLKETGYTNGIENYSRPLSGRAAGEPPSTLLDYMPKDFITFIDESHMTIPQIRGMYHGDRARKEVLVEHGFRLPSALDNRPLTFPEFEGKIGQTIFVSATPSVYERAKGNIVEQLVRPTGLIDPTLEVRPAENQVKDAEKEIAERAKKGERTLVIALTKRMAEDIAEYLGGRGLKIAWLHSEIKTIERYDIMKDLRSGEFDALVGINLLREGPDIPEVSLICILDADKEGFLRNTTTFIQIIGRAARHMKGHVIFYADRLTGSLKEAIGETDRRRKYQIEFNKKHGIKPAPIQKEVRPSLFAGYKKIS